MRSKVEQQITATKAMVTLLDDCKHPADIMEVCGNMFKSALLTSSLLYSQDKDKRELMVRQFSEALMKDTIEALETASLEDFKSSKAEVQELIDEIRKMQGKEPKQAKEAAVNSAALKMLEGLKEALAYARGDCRHEFTYWEHVKQIGAWRRICTKCKIRETVWQRPHDYTD